MYISKISLVSLMKMLPKDQIVRAYDIVKMLREGDFLSLVAYCYIYIFSKILNTFN